MSIENPQPALPPEGEGDSFPNKPKWQGLVRASILSATTQKLFGYVNLADQKAMGIIILNSIIIPIVIGHLEDTEFRLEITIAIITAILSIFTAIVCIVPKRSNRKIDDENFNLLHFNDIGYVSTEEFLNAIRPIYNEPPEMSKIVLRDIHDISKNVLIKKFFWLKLSYITFFVGNLIAITLTLKTIWL